MACKNTDLNFYLKHGVIADALHDFGQTECPTTPYGGYDDAILKGTNESICRNIPVINRYTRKPGTYTEDRMLYELFEKSRILGSAKKMSDRDPGTFVENLVDRLKIGRGKLAFESLHTNPYEVSIFQKNGNPLDFTKDTSQITEENIKDFFGNNHIYLLIDTDKISILRLLADITKHNLIIHHIINREQINDSAPKTHAELEKIHQYIDRTEASIKYDKDKFYTKYDLSLGKIYPETGNNGSFETEFKIAYNNKILYHTTNADDNNLSECKKAFTKSKKEGKQATEWPIIYQRKRSGDWLQVLSCLDKSRKYNDNKYIPESNNLILVTYDRLCLYYAVLMGVNVLFITTESPRININKRHLIYFKKHSAIPAGELAAAAERAVAERTAVARAVAERLTLEREAASRAAASRVAASRAAAERAAAERAARASARSAAAPPALAQRVARELPRDQPPKTPAARAPPPKAPVAVEPRRSPRLHLQTGGTIPEELCKKYISELASDLECLETDENSDYEYYENLSCIILACIKDIYTSENPYEKMHAIMFEILPSVEGYIRTDESEMMQFYEGDKYTADCVSFAARNVALHALGLRTGAIETLDNRKKYNVTIPNTTVLTYKSIKGSLPTDFMQRRSFLIDKLRSYIDSPSTAKTILSKMSSKLPNLRSIKTHIKHSIPTGTMAPAAGGRFNKTRKLRRFKKLRRTRKND